MKIRNAERKDIDKLLKLLSEVLEIHAQLRPDIFVSGTSKYTREELESMVDDANCLIYVAADDNDEVIGYAFCLIRKPQFTNNMVQHCNLFVDDLCVEAGHRGQHIGEKLLDYVKAEARRMGCYEVTLAVWAGNDRAEGFYDRMGFKTKERIMEYIL